MVWRDGNLLSAWVDFLDNRKAATGPFPCSFTQRHVLKLYLSEYYELRSPEKNSKLEHRVSENQLGQGKLFVLLQQRVGWHGSRVLPKTAVRARASLCLKDQEA